MTGQEPTMNFGNEDSFEYHSEPVNIPQPLLNDLCSRFLINIPAVEKSNMVRLCFQIELAHWYYIDFCRQDNPDLPPCGMKAFISKIFQEYKFLNKTNETLQSIYEKWKMYKERVPVFGAILLDESLENCVLVRGYHKKVSWGFPKGKVNHDENGIDCAVREVWEEVGFDIAPLANADEYLENNFHDHQVRLYIVPGVDSDFKFKTSTRDEIQEIRWFPVEFLPTHKKDKTPHDEFGLLASNFFMIHSFIKPLQKWISMKKNAMSPVKIFQPQQKGKDWEEKKEQQRKKRKEKEAEEFKEMHKLFLKGDIESEKKDENLLKSMLGLNVSKVTTLPAEESPKAPLSNGTTSNIKKKNKTKNKKSQDISSVPHGFKIGGGAPSTGIPQGSMKYLQNRPCKTLVNNSTAPRPRKDVNQGLTKFNFCSSAFTNFRLDHREILTALKSVMPR